MTRFTTRLSGLLYVLLIILLAFITIMIGVSIVVVVGDWLSPGMFGEVHVNRGTIDMSAPFAAPSMVGLLVFALGIAGGALLPLIGMLKSTAAGQPFTLANVRRLHIIAGVIAIAFVAQFAVPALLPIPSADIIRPMDGSGIFALLLTLVLAEVFREGVRLREDAELTV